MVFETVSEMVSDIVSLHFSVSWLKIFFSSPFLYSLLYFLKRPLKGAGKALDRPWKTFARSWNNTESPLQALGSPLARPWQPFGKTLKAFWVDLGKVLSPASDRRHSPCYFLKKHGNARLRLAGTLAGKKREKKHKKG